MMYRENETMKMIGYQSPGYLICGDGVAAREFDDLINVYKKHGRSSLIELGVDAFMLGYIYGKRAERRKKKQSNAL